MKVSWQVTGVRQDAWEKAHPMSVEVEKSARERGHYINPELFGASPEKNIDKRIKATREREIITKDRHTKSRNLCSRRLRQERLIVPFAKGERTGEEEGVRTRQERSLV